MRLKIKYPWGPSCWFFDEAMAAHKFNGTEYAVLWLMRRLTFGEPDYNRPGYRKESACISVEEIHRRTGRAPSAIRRALESLERANVLIVVAPAQGTKARELGINSRIDDWKIPRIGQVEQQKYPGVGCLKRGTLASAQGDPKKSTLGASIEAPYGSKKGTLAERNPAPRKAANPPSEIFREQRSPIVPKGDDFFPVFEEHFVTTYKLQTAYSLSRTEKRELEAFARLNPRTESMAKIWNLGIALAMESRAERKEDPDLAPFVSRRPFRDCYESAAEIYRKARAKSQDLPARLAAA